MPFYVYKCPSCDNHFEMRREAKQYLSTACCPKCDEECERDYEAESLPTFADGKSAMDSKYPYVSHRLPGTIDAPKTEKGKPIVMSRKHEREIMAKHNYKRD